MVLCLRRNWHRRRAVSDEVAEWLAVGLPSFREPLNTVSFLAVDVETTGLDPRRDTLVSVGWVKIRNLAIELESARHYLIAGNSVGQSATIHGVRDTDREDAGTLCDVMTQFMKASAGCVLVFHYADLDRRFLGRSMHRCFAVPLLLPWVDTLTLDLRNYRRAGRSPAADELRLDRCRTRYGLPRYNAHNALSDALATGELFLALVAHRAGGAGRLSEVL